MSLKSISTTALLLNTKNLAVIEKRIGIEVIHHLREIDARKAFASIGYSSLFDYCTRELGYAEGSACRRIQAMKLLREIPEYEARLEQGVVNVATLSKVQTFFSQKKRTGKTYSKAEKIEVLKKVEGKSSRQTEQVLAAASPELARPDRARAINENQTEIRFTADKELMEKLEHLNNLLGHQVRPGDFGQLFKVLTDLALKKLDPQKKLLPPTGAVESEESESRYIPVKIKRAVWARDKGKCAYVDPKTGRRCESKYALQIDHIIPFAKGGKSTFSNLKLLCFSHNQFTAIQAYGLEKMQRHSLKD